MQPYDADKVKLSREKPAQVEKPEFHRWMVISSLNEPMTMTTIPGLDFIFKKSQRSTCLFIFPMKIPENVHSSNEF